MRNDLLSLTPDDLSAIANRGLVKRAQRELESAELTYELAIADDGTVTVVWSDACSCTLPSDRPIDEGQCTCSSPTICRHLIRSILAYQQQAAGSPTAVAEGAEEVTESETAQIWNPGTIADAELSKFFNSKQLAAFQSTFKSGLLVEAICGTKPTARFYSPAHTLRFLVPGDLRYTYCDCADPAPCSHVALGIWAFRQLPEGKQSGIVETNKTPEAVPTELLDEIEASLYALLEMGIAKLNSAMVGRLQRLEQNCRQQNLVWVAEILLDILQEGDRYRERDARFSPTYLVELMGELCIRSDAMRHPTGAVPQLLIRGTKGDRSAELGTSRLVGLGCGVRLYQRHLSLSAYFQDSNSGTVMALSRDFPRDGTDYYKLARQSVLKRNGLAALGSSQVLLKGAKRSPNLQLVPGRSAATIHPQNYAWENLRSPLLVDDFSELIDHLSLLPPACLRPRRVTETLHVFAIKSVAGVTFNALEQAVTAELSDRQQHRARLFLPYHHSARYGTELLLRYFSQFPPQFVAGEVRLKAGELWIYPISVVFNTGTTGTIVQPWVSSPDLLDSVTEGALDASAGLEMPSIADPLEAYLERLNEAIAELAIAGLEQLNSSQIRAWENLHQEGLSLGFRRIASLVQNVAELMRSRAETLVQSDRELPVQLLQLALLMVLAKERFA